MSEHVFQHYRTGTFLATVAGSDPPEMVEIRWNRDGQIVHLTVPPGATAGMLGDLPEVILPSQTGPSLLADGQIVVRRGGRTFELTGAAAGGTLHYLAIPGQVEEPEEAEEPEEEPPAAPPAEPPPASPPPEEGV